MIENLQKTSIKTRGKNGKLRGKKKRIPIEEKKYNYQTRKPILELGNEKDESILFNQSRKINNKCMKYFLQKIKCLSALENNEE